MASRRRSGGHAVVLGALALVGCASSTGDERVAKQVEEPILYTGGGGSQTPAPDCLSPNTRQFQIVAKPHTPAYGTGYTTPFPIAGVSNPTIASYEQQVWSIPRTNGYAYLAYVVGDPSGNPGGPRYFFAIGIRDRNAVPSYLMQPPGPADIRYPVGPAPFAATDSDFNSENTLRSKNTGWPVLSHDPQIQCAIVYAEDTGAVLDYFPLADLHDPNTDPW